MKITRLLPRFVLLAAALLAGPLFADNRLYTHTATSTVASDDKIYLDGATNGTRALAPNWWANTDLAFNYTGNVSTVVGLRGKSLPSLVAGLLRYDGNAWVVDSAAYITNPLTTAGDLFVGGSSGVPARLGQGSNGTFLGVQGGVLGYYTPGGGGNVSNSGTPTAGQAAEWTSATVIQGVAVTGSGTYVKSTSPTITTPTIAAIANLTSNGFMTTSGGVGTLGISAAGANVITALAIDVGNAGAIVVNGGALGTPLSGNVQNLTGTASININGTVGATTPNTGAFTTGVFGSTASVTVGTTGTTEGQILFKNATSGTATLAPPTGALGTYTVRLPNAASVLPVFGQQITFAGPTAARTVTIPDANSTLARTDAGQTFTGSSNASGWVLTSPTITTGITPTVNAGAALGSSALQFANLFLASGGVINFSNGDLILTHSTGILTLSPGDLRITTAGTNAASVVTVGGTQTLTNKTFTAPALGAATATSINKWAFTAPTTAATLTAGGDSLTYTFPASSQTIPGLTDAVTFTNKRITVRTSTTTSSATPLSALSSDNFDKVKVTALATAITSMNWASGTPVDGDVLVFDILDNGSARAITWGSQYEDGLVAKPSTTTAGKHLVVVYSYQGADSKWFCMNSGSQL